ncbi:MAG TPA: hypothetical protein VLJ59_18720 [Mycobacteriales bacterium]|nr:hypothetical protein [Mycobacteriales bacterium]
MPVPLDVPTTLLAHAEHGTVTDAEFIDCVRQSPPYAWSVISRCRGRRARERSGLRRPCHAAARRGRARPAPASPG